NEIVFKATTSDGGGYYWQAATYDDFDGQSWHQSDRVASRVDAGQGLLDQTPEAPTAVGRRDISAIVSAVAFGGDLVISPAAPRSIDRPAEVWTNGAAGPFALAEFAGGLNDGESYVVQASVRAEKEADGGLTRALLASAGQDYPAWLARYVRIEPGSVGPLTESTAHTIYDGLPPDRRDDFHVADAIQRYLDSTGGFQYAIDVRGVCTGSQIVECFLTSKVGYCEYFATTMVMLLRELGIPSRMVMGYLPGQRQPDGSWLVSRGAAHAWVEVYFPTYGWVPFDPTPGNQANGQRPSEFEAGAALPTSGASPGASGPLTRRTFAPDASTGVTGTGVLPPTSGGSGPLLVALLVILGMGALIIG
ncbi:MAG: transglutaminaseTgpA domain-containing protein, partial [Gaiellales bacterium]